LYWVVDNNGNKLERLPITKEKAEKQIVAIYLSKRKEKKRSDASIRKEVFGSKA
jgi:hypothetical protein